MPLQTSGKVSVTGAIAFGDIHAIHGNQLQPSFVWVDHMGGTIMDTLTDPTNMKADRVLGVSHAAPVFVPFHQKIESSNVTLPVDNTQYIPGMAIPIVSWTCTNTGSVTPKQTAYADRYFGFEYFETVLPEAANLSDATNLWQIYEASQYRNTDGGSVVSFDEQGFTLFIQKQKLGYVNTVNPTNISISWEVYTKGADKSGTEPGVFELTLYQNKPPELTLDGRSLRSAMSFGTHPIGMIGSMGNADLTLQQFVQVMIVGGRMQVTVPGTGVPIVVHLERIWHATVSGIPVNKDQEPQIAYAYVPKGVADRLPASLGGYSDIDIYRWPSGQHPIMGVGGNATKFIVTDRWPAGTCPDIPAETLSDEFDVIKSNTNLEAGIEIGILEPRIGKVTLSVKGFSQYSFSLHPMRFANNFSYTSIQQQLGFTPSVTTPPTFDLHMHADIAKNLDSGETHTCKHIPTAQVTLTDEHLAGSQISQYSLSCVSTETPFAYAGINTVRYTPGIERISIRYAGITELDPPDEETYNIFAVGEGQNGCAEYLVSVTEESSFDFGGMRVHQNLGATFNNYSGIQQFAQDTGVRGAGNIALCWRWGYKHSEGINGQEGPAWWSTEEEPVYGPGWGRLYGFCDTYAFSGTTGRYSLTLQGKSMMARLDDTVFHAPPNMDGWNHYRAVYTLLSMAGIPDSRIGFMTEVPDDPYGLEATDPDFDTGGYFLPVGVGSNPWTPIARSMTVGQLMGMIQQVTQFILYVDDLGIWRYEPFMRDATGNPKRIFREYYPYDSNQGLTQMWDVNVTISTADVRNEVILVGIDAYNPLTFLDPIFAAERDELSINANPSQQPANYIGWKKNFAMTDSRFATAEFAKKTAKRLFDTMRQPAVIVTFSCWGQPDIYPMDFIGVEYQRSGLSGFPAVLGVSEEADNTIPLFVTKISTTITRTARGLIPTSRIEARYIPLEAYQDLGDGVSSLGKTKGDSSMSNGNNTGGGTGQVGP